MTSRIPSFCRLSFLSFIFTLILPFFACGQIFRDGTGVDTTLMTSPPRSIRTMVANGGTSGRDADTAKAYRDFSYYGGPVSLQINYRVAVQTDSPDGWGGACSVTDLRVRCFDAANNQIGLYTYCLSCCRSTNHNNNYRTGNITYILPPGISRDSEGDIHLNPNTWYTLNVTPSSDLNINWNQVSKIRIELTAGGTYMYSDTIDVYWDDLVLSCGANVYTDNMTSATWTFEHENPYTDSIWAAGFYPSAPAGPYFISPLDPDPNPAISTVMAGGHVHRYYLIRDSQDWPVSTEVTISASGRNFSNSSDENGLLKIDLNSDQLGTVNETINCSITAVAGEQQENPVTFQVQILPRDSTANLKFGSGINVGAAIGVGAQAGEKRGFVYQILNTDASTSSDDKIGIKKAREMEAGVYAGGSVGGGVKGVCYAGAEAEAGVSAVFSSVTDYLFPDPYSQTEQILRAGLILSTCLEVTPPLLGSIITWIVNNYNPLYINYWHGDEFAAGAKITGSASAGAGLGIGDDENVLLGVGVGAGIEGTAQIMAEIGAWPAEYAVGIKFSGGLDLSAGIEAGAVGSKVGAGLEGNLAGEYELKLYYRGTAIDRAEISFSSTKDWGIGLTGDIKPGTDTSTRTVIIINSDQINTIAATFSDLANLSHYVTSHQTASILLGPTRLKQEIVDLFNLLNSIPIAYRIIKETGTGFQFEPTFELGLGVEVKAGFSINMEKSVEFVAEEGIFLNNQAFPLATYEYDWHLPGLNSLDFTAIAQDALNGVITAMTAVGDWVSDTLTEVVIPVIEDGIETLTETVITAIETAYDLGTAVVNTAADACTDFFDYVESLFGGKGQQVTAKSNEPFSSHQFAVNGVFTFQPAGLKISQISACLTRPLRLSFHQASITINPGSSTAILTITYTDQEISGLAENDLKIFQWNLTTGKWRFLANSSVNESNNQVTASITELGSFCLGVSFPAGPISLHVNPPDADLSSPAVITVTSEPIRLNTGQAVPDGTLITVSSTRRYGTTEEPFGTITTADAAADIDGIQVATVNGVITFQINPPDIPGTGIIRARSVGGLAGGKNYFHVVTGLDSDSNGLPDYWEKSYFGQTGQNPDEDPDNDGLSNLQEYLLGTNPQNNDSDGDGMSDGWEVQHQLNPRLVNNEEDVDQDGLNNEDEFLAGTDPRNSDSDGDGMSDGWEVRFGSDPTVNDADSDLDGDGLSNTEELTLGTNPLNADTDNDGMSDGWEVGYGLNPLIQDGHLDNDGDGFTNQEEFNCKTAPDDSNSHPAYAAGCWPMFRYLPTHTGQPPFFGPIQASVKWRYGCGRVYSSPAVAPDGTIYFGDYDSGVLRAVKPDGNLLWAAGGYGQICSSPAIGYDGTIYVGSYSGNLLAYYPNGTLRWAYHTGATIDLASPTIGPEGTIYIGNDAGFLTAVNPDGTLKWVYQTGYQIQTTPAIAPDGTIYIGNQGKKLYALNPNGTLKWIFPTQAVFSMCSPAIGKDGTVYITTNGSGACAYAINPDGSQKWVFNSGSTNGSPAISDDGTIYIPGWDYLFAVNPDGTEKRRFSLSRPSSPVIGADGIICVGSTGWQKGYGFKPDGTMLWVIPFGYDHWLVSSPALSPDGTVYFTTAFGSGAYGYLHAFSGVTYLGDINQDTSVDIQDVILALRMCLGLPAHITSRSYLPPYPASAFYRADFNSDRSLDVCDVISIVRKVLGYQ